MCIGFGVFFARRRRLLKETEQEQQKKIEDDYKTAGQPSDIMEGREVYDVDAIDDAPQIG